MNILKTLFPLVLLTSLLVVACQQPTAPVVDIPEANKALVTYSVTGMT